MSEIPEDIMLMAEELAGRIRSRDDASQVIARAILNERDRCAAIASKVKRNNEGGRSSEAFAAFTVSKEILDGINDARRK